MRRPVVLFVLSSIISISDGKNPKFVDNIGVRNACGYTYFACECGRSKEIVNIPIELCQTHKWKLRCRPCDKLKSQIACQKFVNCQSCNLNSLTCSSCPQHKYGFWCEIDCQCQNSVGCHQETGKCLCKEGFEGNLCEIKRGCTLPIVRPPLVITSYPPNAPIYINYTCINGYSLLGSSHNICKNKKWHNSSPECVIAKTCSNPPLPEYGEIETKKSVYTVGETVTYSCKSHYQLLGEKINMCDTDGKWRNGSPTCVKLKLCGDPGTPKNAVRNIAVSNDLSEGIFPEGTVIKYECKKSFLIDGKHSIVCKGDQTWSHHIPKCVKVAEIDVTCDTKGSDLIEDVGTPVRIHCLPGCVDSEGDVWGTIIYKEESSVCAAAIHSGRIESNGGSVYVINNGMYNDFIGSELNDILSHSYLPRAKSFQLESISSVKIDDKDRIVGCPPSWEQFDEYCIFINNDKRKWDEAKYICQNMAGQLISLNDNIERKLKSILQNKDLNNLWIGLRKYSGEFKWENQDNLNENGKWSNGEPNERNDCVSISGYDIKWKTSDCNLQLSSICLINLYDKKKVKCKLPSSISNGKIDYQNVADNEVPEGFILTFSCDRMYHLNGNKTLRCLENGNWNGSTPTCIKVTACEEPPTPAHGLKEISSSQSVAISRIAIINSGLPTDPPSNLPEPKSGDIEDALPAGYYRVGTRVKYSCESRYYQLVGSQARRCTKDGDWSGRLASCIPVCGRSDSKRAPFILNGNATEIGQWPWQAALARQISDSNRWFLLCGGALLSEQWVITAAHCVTRGATNKIIEPDKFKIYLGKFYRDDKLDDDSVQERRVEEILIHPDFDPHLFDADIALLHLDEPVTLTARVQTVCLPTGSTTRDHIVDGKIGLITGWGLNENQSYSQQLQQAVLPVVSHERCEKAYEDADLPLTVTENMFCAGSSEINSDSCSGDSGGPMVFADDTARERKWVLEGLVSWGSPTGCGTVGQYGGFTKVFNFKSWIHQFL